MSVAVRFAARTDVGLVRSRNEDSGYAGPHLLAVADGMGGHAGGNVASSLVLARLAPLDGDSHGPAASRLIQSELARRTDALQEARESARLALQARRALWDGAAVQLRALRETDATSRPRAKAQVAA